MHQPLCAAALALSLLAAGTHALGHPPSAARRSVFHGGAPRLGDTASHSIRVTLGQFGKTLGRVRVYLAQAPSASGAGCGNVPEPRETCSDDQDTSQVFGVDTPTGGLAPASCKPAAVARACAMDAAC